MKIILSQREILAGGTLTNSIGFGVTEIENLIHLNDGVYRVQELATILNLTDENIAKVNKQMGGVLTITKADDNFIFEIEEQFLVDFATVGTGFVKEIFDSLKYLFKGMFSFISLQWNPFKDKWEKIVENRIKIAEQKEKAEKLPDHKVEPGKDEVK